MDANDESYFSREIRIALSESEASIMILLEEAYNKGYDEGWEDGKESGHDDGYNEGYGQGVIDSEG